MMSGFWKWTIAALGLVGLGIAVFAPYDSPMVVDPVRQVADYPDVEQDYWRERLMSGKTLPDVEDIRKHCARHICPKFPTGYHSYQTEQGWFYIPLVWSRLPKTYYADGRTGWTFPRFSARPGRDFEHRNAEGRIDKRISFKGNGALSLRPFFANYEPGFPESGNVAWGSIKEVDARLNCRDSLAAGNTNSALGHFSFYCPPSGWEDDVAGSLTDYDDNFWLVRQQIAEYGTGVEHEFLSKEPIFRGHRALIHCFSLCRVRPLASDGSEEKVFLLSGSVYGSPFFLDFARPGRSRPDPYGFTRQLEENNGYAFKPGGSDLLVEYVKAADRMIDRMQAPDPAFMDYE